MNQIIFKRNVYWLELGRLLVIIVLLGSLSIYTTRTDLFFPILLPTIILILFLTIRQFRLYTDKIELRFLYRREVIPLGNIAKVIYHYTGGGGGSPVVIFKTHDKNSIPNRLYKFFMYRFILRDNEQLIFLLKFFKNNGIEIKINTSESFTKKLNEAIK